MSSETIRFAPHTASPAEVAAANEAGSFQGARAYDSTERALRRVQEAYRALNATRLDALLYHPDERVPLAIAAGFTAHDFPKLCTQERAPAVVKALYTRARQSAEEEGVLWNPLLDTLVGTGAIATSPNPRTGWRSLTLPLAELQEAVRNNTDPEWLRQVLRLRTTEIRTMAAREAQFSSPEVLQEAIGDFSLLPFLASNESLSPEQKGQVLQECLSLIPRSATFPSFERREVIVVLVRVFPILARSGLHLSPEQQQDLLRLLEEHERIKGTADSARRLNHYVQRHSIEAISAFQADFPLDVLLDTYQGLGDVVLSSEVFALLSDPRMDAERRQRLLSTSRNESLEERCLRSPLRAEPEVRDWLLATGSAYTLNMLLALEDEPELRYAGVQRVLALLAPSSSENESHESRRKQYLDGLLRISRGPELDREIAEQVADDRELSEKFLNHESTHIEACRRIARETRSRILRTRLSLHERLRVDPEVRSILLSSADPYLLRNLASTATPAELQMISRRIGQKSPHLLLEVLEKAPEEVRQEVDVAVLLPLLSHGNQQFRLRAMQLLHQLRTSAQPTVPSTQQSSPATRRR